MQDGYGRETEDLRISLTQRCNLDCVFCHMEGQLPSSLELTAEEIERCVIAATKVGVRRVKLTGGEPTLRSDLPEIVRRIAAHVEEVSMTTNGLLLDRLAVPLHEAGLRRVNVSLPSALPATYRRLTGGEGLPAALRGIRAAHAAGIFPMKLNVVVLAGITEQDAEREAIWEIAHEVGATLQFIEFEPVQGRVDGSIFRVLHAEITGLDSEVAGRAVQSERNPLHHRPRYTVPNGKGPMKIEIVRPLNNPEFCSACHRIRLTSYGALKGCLMTNEHLVETRPMLRDGATPDQLVPLFEQVIQHRRPFFRADTSATPSLELPLVARAVSGASPHLV